MAALTSAALPIGAPLRAVITSWTRTPACAAGPSGSILVTSAPLPCERPTDGDGRSVTPRPMRPRGAEATADPTVAGAVESGCVPELISGDEEAGGIDPGAGA